MAVSGVPGAGFHSVLLPQTLGLTKQRVASRGAQGLHGIIHAHQVSDFFKLLVFMMDRIEGFAVDLPGTSANDPTEAFFAAWH